MPELAVIYLNDKAKHYVEPLARQIETPILMPLDVAREGQMEAVFEEIARQWGRLDLALHSMHSRRRKTCTAERSTARARAF
jgi:enoyl-[acyl-carrier protein] reductase I